ncbi:MAG TPA: DUF2235 domain-containing protein [Chitinophagaceae bacterium]|nr:DUF2235 domain-containing protein [Chitinophagaceae bacterium]
MPKNIVVLCDGTGNQVESNLSNVLKLFRILQKNTEQVVFYDPGIGTIGNLKPWSRFKQNLRKNFCLATGTGLEENVLDCYRFLIDNYEDEDQVYLFGYSRGAYTVRVLAGLLHMIGLLRPEQKNLNEYALNAYKESSRKDDFQIGWRFATVTGTQKIPIKFMGVWDTVSSVLIPTKLIGIKQQATPYTAKNPIVEVLRHAIAIDERRRMFRVNHWTEPQEYRPNFFDEKSRKPQDIKQVWFAGVHSDVGGGYPEEESGLAKFPLKWMVDEARQAGIKVNTAMFNHLVLGQPRAGSKKEYVAPNASANQHNSLGFAWKIMEIFPKPVTRRDWPKRISFLGLYIPWGEPRYIDEGAMVHRSVIDRMHNRPDYKPINLPASYQVVDDQ